LKNLNFHKNKSQATVGLYIWRQPGIKARQTGEKGAIISEKFIPRKPHAKNWYFGQ
jgi:hypothetical protein